jgi:hypothetical protein
MEPAVIYASDPDVNQKITYRPRNRLDDTFAGPLDRLWRGFNLYYTSRETSEEDATAGVTAMKGAVADMLEGWNANIKQDVKDSEFAEASKHFEEVYRETPPSECSASDE